MSSFLNYARATGVGISRAVSAGNASAVTVADYLDFYASDPATGVGLAYVEGIVDGRGLLDQLSGAAARKPLVLVKGGATAGGAKAAASHTGALAANDKVFEGECRAAGITRAATVEEAFEAAATFATQPAPRGPRVVVLTTAGGWGVVTSDAITRDRDLELIDLPGDLKAAIDQLLPPRWSRSNPVDCAGGETRDTIPAVMQLIAEHDEVDAIVYLGLGIQSNQGRMMREGRFYPDHGLERIVEYHERQDARFAQAAADLSDATGKPILTATELAIADPDNAGPATVRATGRLCYAEREPRGDGARPPLPGRPPPAASLHDLMPSRSSSTNPLVALTAIVLLPALALVGLWRFAAGQSDGDAEPVPTTAPGTPAPPAPGPPLETPLISFRRVPGLVARDLNADAFREQVAGFANTLDATSCVVVQLDGVEVGAHNPDLAVIPASNQKLLVAAAALHVLGTDFRFTDRRAGRGLGRCGRR